MKLYESTLVGAFNYLWGYHDATEGKPSSMAILSNAQNPLDKLLGDMIGHVDGRYFLIEFKADKSGFFDEVHAKNSKVARTDLYEHLRNDSTCRNLARFGHFGVWSNGTLRVAPYAHAVGPGEYAGPHELNAASFEIDFDKFYAAINCPDKTVHWQRAGLYASGLGLPVNAMLEYLECILQQFPGVVEPSYEANAIFGFCNPDGASVVAIPTSFEGLLWSFQEVKRLTQKQNQRPDQSYDQGYQP